MMIRFLFAILIFAASLGPKAQAQQILEDKILSTDLANNRVEITSGFDGEYLTVFGVQDQEGELAITITCPEKETTVRRKDQVFGVWMNRQSLTFENVPAYYRIGSSVPIQRLAAKDILKQHKIGVDTMRFETAEKTDQLKSFQDAMIRNKKAQNLYSKDILPVTHIDKNFFRAQFNIPANAPVGDYKVRTYLFDQGKLITADEKTVKIMQVGTGAAIYNYAQNWSLAYGLLCVIFARASGWLSSIIRQRIR